MISIKGLNLIDLARFASSLSLASRAVRVELDELAQLQTPCILHWQLSHFVVLQRVTSHGAIIHDPARGRRHVSRAELSENFTGIALEASPTEAFERKTEINRINIPDLFRHVVGLRRALTQIFLLSLCLEAFAILSPIGSQIIFDDVIVSSDYDLLTLVAMALGTALLLQTIIGLANSWATLIMGTNLSLQWTTSLFDHLLRLPLAYFEKRQIGDVISRFGSLGAIQSALTTDVISAVLDCLMAIGALIMMIVYGGVLSLVAMITLTVHLLIRLVSYAPYRAASQAQIIKSAKQSSHFIETIRGISGVKTLDLHERRRGAWLNLVIDATNAGLQTRKLDYVFGTIGTLLSGLDGIIMLIIGTRAVMAGNMTIGMLIAFIAYKDQFVGRVSALIGLGVRLKMLSLHAERIGDIALTLPEEAIEKNVPGFRVNPEPAHVTLKNIGFSYGEGLPDVLSAINLEIVPGECVAIVGPSGCGKTTLLKIMAGLHQPSRGTVLIDGQDIRHYGLINYRRTTATVQQEDALFAGTIAENIASFDPVADQTFIETCASMAAIDHEIKAMPMGYDSLVGDMGNALSGGQKQRLFLARALYSKPRILFLDEATSDLDEANEARINKAIVGLNITRIIVAHRPSTIALADRVISLETMENKSSIQLGQPAIE